MRAHSDLATSPVRSTHRGRRAARLLLLAAVASALVACAATNPPGEPTASCRDVMGHGSSGHSAHAPYGGALSAASVLNPQPSPPPPTPTRAWSDAAGWPEGRLPSAGDDVVIQAGEVVLLDVSPPPLAGLVIDGALVFDRRDLELRSDKITVHGGLFVGSAEQPFLERASIVLTGAQRTDDGCLGSKYIAVLGGALELYGDPQGQAWTALAATAPAGAQTITVDDASGWRVGDSIVIASTDFYAYAGEDGERYDRQVEERKLVGVTGNLLTLDEPLEFEHYGEDQAFGSGSDQPNKVLRSRAEVARLSRNVTVAGEQATQDPGSDRFRFGGHIMAMGESRVRLDSVELTRMGQRGILLRYPLHFHLMGDAGHGSFVRNSSLHHLYNRCITIHGTNGVLLEGNAAFDSFGHCYFLEDGAEKDNAIVGNLGLMVRAPAEEHALLASDTHFLGPAMFWITNPANHVADNVAASSEGSGFWYALPEHPTGPSFHVFDGENWWPRRTPLGVFAGNLAHSNAADGLHVDRGPTSDTLGVETTPYRPRSDPADSESAPVLAVFEGYSAYKHRSAAAWFRGDHTVLRGALLVDNAIGATFASNASGLERSLVVGESDNLGTPMPWEATGAGGRSLPRPWDEDFAIRGFEFYDGTVWVDDTHFEGFAPTAQRGAGAISVLDYTSFSLSPASFARGVTFALGTNQVHLETRSLAGFDPATSDSAEDGYRSAVFRDADGSLTGTAGAYVTVDNELLIEPSCAYRAAWNAQVCHGRYVGLSLYDRSDPPIGVGPVTVHRGDTKDTSPEHVMHGTPHGGADTPNRHFRTLVPLGHEYHYETAGPIPERFTLDIDEAADGDTLFVSVPYPWAEPHIYRDWWIDARNEIARHTSLGDLRASSDSGYVLTGSRLYLKLATQDGRDWAHLTVCRHELCD